MRVLCGNFESCGQLTLLLGLGGRGLDKANCLRVGMRALTSRRGQSKLRAERSFDLTSGDLCEAGLGAQKIQFDGSRKSKISIVIARGSMRTSKWKSRMYDGTRELN